MTKTTILTGVEVQVDGLGGQNVAIKNLGAVSVYASAYPHIIADADNVIEIPAGGGEILLDAHGTVYLLGVGKVQCTGTDYSAPNFKMPSSSENGGGGTSDVSKAYVDARDDAKLEAAKQYTDGKVLPLQATVNEHSGEIDDLTAQALTAAAALAVLNGTGAGSVKKQVADGLAEFTAGAPEGLNSLREIAEWILAHPDDAAALNAQIQQCIRDVSGLESLKADKAELADILSAAKEYTNGKTTPIDAAISELQSGKADTTEVAGVFDAAKVYTNGQIGNVNNSIAALQTTKADKSELPVVSNPNLLDNWYFVDPINQRSVSGTISDTGYFVDRWKLVNGSVEISSYGFTLNGTIEQILETAPDQALTASYLTNAGVQAAEYDSVSKTFAITGNGVLIKAAKLEFGNHQTLAHQDENGNWVLNDPPPNMALELTKCRRHYRVYGPGITGITHSGNRLVISLPFENQMRGNSTCSLLSSEPLHWYINGKEYLLSNCSIAAESVNQYGISPLVITGTWDSEPPIGVIARFNRSNTLLFSVDSN